MVVNNELETVWKEGVVAYLKALPRPLLRETEKFHERLLSG
jgi:hypothetical protein